MGVAGLGSRAGRWRSDRVLAAIHEHYDNVAGFSELSELSCGGNAASEADGPVEAGQNRMRIH